MKKFQIFLVATPGLEEPLRAEALETGFHNPRIVPGGVIFDGTWAHVWRANLRLRGAVRVLARVAVFKAHHLKQLGPETRAIDWAALLAPGTPFRVEAVCRKSKLYHAGAVAERVTGAIAEVTGAVPGDAAELRILARVEKDHVTLSIDTSGAPLHKRGHKEAVGKAPLRETMAAMFLRQMGFDGTQSVVDPMCGSGTIPIEAAEIAAGLAPGRSRTFAFEALQGIDRADFPDEKSAAPQKNAAHFFGSDRDAGVIKSAEANAARSGVAVSFACKALSEARSPNGLPGLVLINPPYGDRIGDVRALTGLYASFGQTMRTHFQGWRIGVITTREALVRACGLPMEPGPPVAHGGLKVRLWQGKVG
ncbi:THUMP domain-containing class I SAM-dependent RNA methyltransferase [Pseudaestuariivita sp.]|uniref:THUMP domain-containing class I SAM-dependent RNA methyltransferase n=1 Tax=Pseudaestuariivita sp. TaxID=2211669 RepID=UPI004058FB1D